MKAKGISRSTFISLAAAVQAAILPMAANAQVELSSGSAETGAVLAELQRLRHGRRALVLRGGGARGAYQAGMVHTWAYEQGLKDGQPLPQYDLICGTSIGALNGYMIATGRYTALKELWLTLGRQNVVQLKPKYHSIVDGDAGVLDRVGQAVGLALGARANVTGVLDAARVRQWLVENIDASAPVLVPLVWTVTNLSEQRPEFFYRVPTSLSAIEHDAAVAAIKDTVGPDTAVREASNDLLIDALLASASIPLAFDPVVLPSPSGGTAQYVDGGVTANTPIGVARAFAANVDVVLVDPKFEPEVYKNLLEIGIGVFGTMEQRILDADIRAAFFETFGRHAFDRLSPADMEQLVNGSASRYEALRDFVNALYASTFYVKRPAKALPVQTVGFSDQQGLYDTYVVGMKDGAAPFELYEHQGFEF